MMCGFSWHHDRLISDCMTFQEAQNKLLELDRLSQELDAIVEKAKTATIDEQEVLSDTLNAHCSPDHVRPWEILGLQGVVPGI